MQLLECRPSGYNRREYGNHQLHLNQEGKDYSLGWRQRVFLFLGWLRKILFAYRSEFYCHSLF